MHISSSISLFHPFNSPSIKYLTNLRRNALGSVEEIKAVVIEEAQKIADEDAANNHKMGKNGSVFIKDGDTILTHCNAGELCAVEYGTALGVVRAAWEEGKKIKLIAVETRPRIDPDPISSDVPNTSHKVIFCKATLTNP